MSRVRATTAAVAAGVLVLAGCGDGGGDGPDPGPSGAELVGLRSELVDGDAAAVGAAVNGFGFDLLGEVAAGPENAVTSPLSGAVLLAMVLAGAGGDTAGAMAEVLHLDDSRDVRVGALLAALADTEEVTLEAGNALWADPETPFEPDYLDFVRDRFAATVDNADLGSPETAATIDDWVAERTDGRITEMAEALGLPNPDAALVLLNAVHFLGEWTTEFDPDDTREQPFTLPGGEAVEVPLMHLRDQPLAYAERPGYEVLRLPYGERGRYGMEVLLPDPEASLAELVEQLDADEWGAAVAELSERTVDEVALPRFELAWDAELNGALERLGMAEALDPELADFSVMSSARLYLEQVVQKTYLRVDEAGTEAAAVTGGSMGVTSAQPQLEFRVDRPFAFTISDQETGTILFLGTVTDPRG